jgi:hypothetical protein
LRFVEENLPSDRLNCCIVRRPGELGAKRSRVTATAILLKRCVANSFEAILLHGMVRGLHLLHATYVDVNTAFAH